MIKIEVHHTHIKINDYHLGDYENLEKYFSVWNPTNFSYKTMGMYYDESTNSLYLPRGIDLGYLRKLFNCVPMVDKRHDPFDMIEPYKLKFPPRPRQKEALRFMLGKREYKYTSTKSSLCLYLSPGFGKTYLSIATTAITRLRSIMITSSLNWIEQWKHAILEEHTDIKPREIFVISGTPSIHMLLKHGVKEYKWILASIDTLKEYAKRYGWNQFSELFKFMRVGIKYFDEAHLQFDAMSMIDFFTDTYKTYYLTGSPYKSNEDENRIYKMYFKNIPHLDLFDEDLDPHTSYTAYIYNSEPSPSDISMCRSPKYGVDRNKYVGSYIIRSQRFFDITRLIMERTLATKGKILIFVSVNSTIEVLKRWMEAYYPFLIGHIGIYNSKIPKDKKRLELDKKYILSTTKSAGTAMDIDGLSTTVILAEPFKSQPLTIQTFGRTRKDGSEMLEVFDRGFKGLMGYYYKKQPTIQKYATEMNELRFNSMNLDNAVYDSMDKFYGTGEFPKIYLENDKRMFMLRILEEFPFNEMNKKGKRIFMKRIE